VIARAHPGPAGSPTPATAGLRPLHPVVPTFASDWLDVGDGHRIHVRQFGRPDGPAAVVLHGGPGSGGSVLLPRFLDPTIHRVICPDQRGTGGSTPRGGLVANATDDLLADLRRLRQALQVPRWLVVAGSWGATLALCHAADEPAAVSGLLLRATFVARDEDVDWFFRGARALRPGAWSRFAAVLPEEAHEQPLDHLARCLIDEDAGDRATLARAWFAWEQALSAPSSIPEPGAGSAAASPRRTAPDAHDALLVDRYRVQAHYLRHGCWLDRPSLLERCARIPPVPTLLLHGAEDIVCRPAAALEVARALQAAGVPARFRLIEGAGHDPTHAAMVDAIVRAAGSFASEAAGSR
jgi:proline iminopeptidase